MPIQWHILVFYFILPRGSFWSFPTPMTPQLLFFNLCKFFLLLSLRHRFLVVQLFPMLLPECGQPQQQRLLETFFTYFSQKIGEPLTRLTRGSGWSQSCQSSNGKFFIDLKITTTHLSFDHGNLRTDVPLLSFTSNRK